MFPVVDREVHMLDLLTLWLTRPLDRYEATPVQRRAEQAVYPLLRRPTGRPRVATQKEVRVN